VKYVAGLLDQIGLGGERIEMVNLSAAMGAQFAEAVTEMTEKVRKLGPNPLRDTPPHSPPPGGEEGRNRTKRRSE
jgi:coenzyme F420-reducing hydrogenase delta subunit